MSSSSGQGQEAAGALAVTAESRVRGVSVTRNIRGLFSHVRVENLVAGLSGGVASTLVLHPLDLVKVRFAVSDGLELRPKYYSVWHCMRSIWKQEGLRGLYQGVTPNVWGAGASWGLYFFFYSAIKAYVQEGRQTELSPKEHLVSAAQAGAMTLCITNPIWVTKTRLVLQYSTDPSQKLYRGMVDALVKIYRQEGVAGLYRGFVPGLFGTSHGALQFMAYEELKRDYNKYRNKHSHAKLNSLEYISMAAVSKIFAVATTYPYQVIRARLQDQHTRYNGVIDVIRRTWRNEGPRGFYKGIVPNLIRVTPASCITFVVYETVSSFLLDQRK
ncbi:solute carrier family 25 member 32b [Neoarius graeffei]|uniref:solute carrier family 25 member 32b n=1 Tax=Neoarius graeffei TaxID=443677 RepID=UPI00298C0A45|nr:solute carrier family 25 member 32b [Neoarius graeffei]XP_060756960.1 solute carrier family 25 member 32b [Neoarius graeffei]XP_060756961.1 solute carrier family 25 member 32b [Neoarius graeffei]XP_060756962.1 solute carrier family 25 member 32b [Neoarius graeffei]